MKFGRLEDCNLRVQKNIFGNFCLKNRFFVLILGLWAKILEDFSLKTSGSSFRTDIKCPEEQIEKTNFLWKIEVFLSFPHFAQ